MPFVSRSPRRSSLQKRIDCFGKLRIIVIPSRTPIAEPMLYGWQIPFRYGLRIVPTLFRLICVEPIPDPYQVPGALTTFDFRR